MTVWSRIFSEFNSMIKKYEATYIYIIYHLYRDRSFKTKRSFICPWTLRPIPLPNFHPEFIGTFDQMSVGQRVYLTSPTWKLPWPESGNNRSKSTKNASQFGGGCCLILKLRSGNRCNEFPQYHEFPICFIIHEKLFITFTVDTSFWRSTSDCLHHL